MKTFKELKESINEARKYSVLDTKKNQIVSRPNITKAAAQKLVDKDPENRIMGSPEFIHDKRTAALEEVETERGESVDERKELTYRIHKDGKPLKKGGKTVEIYGVAKAKKMVDDLNKKHRGSKFTAHHVYKDGDDLDENKKSHPQGSPEFIHDKRTAALKEAEFAKGRKLSDVKIMVVDKARTNKKGEPLILGIFGTEKQAEGFIKSKAMNSKMEVVKSAEIEYGHSRGMGLKTHFNYDHLIK